MSKQFQRKKEDFICDQCNTLVQGNGYTNHCPKCLWSKHVDIQPGDRAETCHGGMKPIALLPKTGGGLDHARILHKCVQCGYEKWNESSSEDSSESLLALFAQREP